MNPIVSTEARKGRKYEQVQEGALSVFLRDGFEGASVDEIARVAGVSKATLYSYFPDKRMMFAEVFSAECHRHANEAEAELGPDLDAPAVLTLTARKIIDFTLSDFGRRLFRLMVAEVARFPELARLFYINGPGKLRQRLIARLTALCERGELQIEDFELATDQFVQLSKALIQDRVLLGLVEDIRSEEIEDAITGAVETFLARYGTGR
ncbi:TetR/AcrR family transcriptional regulator [Xinfangfangia sp. D13-10-4-6]|uniref:TetR/AcrR family transcriptional regulator n=1 Tax=Pseudogemmobacter hezensis TaxID=2737662 RepID=UPI00155816CF|nr:TetR/AcrR family transcriptional regulator [Pseudogemmobacter hezensis]NPD15419.1 TetR/AcrR family transcriptional regulator [Pseudogemmobacter hezensis]